jgi:KUP system potassium uptake protein
LLNYLGQGAWLLAHYRGQVIAPEIISAGFNPFIGVMPVWFKLPGIIISTVAAVIACQALISGSFTLISEAMRLNLWPKMKINYPTEEKGQLYIAGISLLLYIGCVGVVLFFRESANMGAAYGLAITMCMISTSILFANFLVSRRVAKGWIYLYLTYT